MTRLINKKTRNLINASPENLDAIKFRVEMGLLQVFSDQ